MLGTASVVVVVLGWFAVLITGTLPMGMFRFLEGLMRWGLRVAAYAFLLTNGTAIRRSAWASSVDAAVHRCGARGLWR